MEDICDPTFDSSFRWVLERQVAHPRKISAAHNLFFTAVEVAVVLLEELLMTLEEVHYLLIELRNVEFL